MGSLRIAAAYDEAFCFYYRENFRELERSGLEIVFFSPMESGSLPRDISGLYLGGGYPELHVKELSGARDVMVDIKQKIDDGLPVIAECGGFMYLNKAIFADDGDVQDEMCGVFDASCRNAHRLVRFGYVTVTEEGGKWLPGGAMIRGHEFHHYESTDNGDGCIVTKASDGSTYREIHVTDTLWAGWPHLYFASAPCFARGFADKCRQYRNRM